MIQETSVVTEKTNAVPKKSKLGVILFFIYTIIYAGFVLIGITRPEWMGLELIEGQNVAIIYGFGLIVLAIVMGFIYNYFCTKKENKMNKNV